ncbi:MAG TPA: cupin domain-containing protein [Gaiellaceae bacterium]|nr:cupin domain-containing protein [Gaiellaceae bacterium]
MTTGTTAAATGQGAAEPFRAVAGSREVWWIDGRVDVKLTGAESGGHLGMWLWTAERGAASPRHVHHRDDEQFLLLDGEARFFVGERVLEARAGDLVFLPHGIPHAYLITSPQARAVGTVTPGGFEGFFIELGTPWRPGSPAPPPPSIEAFARAGERYGFDILGPPPELD